MIKSVSGKNWGASSRIKMITYKGLIRPIIDYVPFAPLIMSKNNQNLLEVIQRKAIKYSFYKPRDTKSTEIY